MLQVQSTIGYSNYVQRDQALQQLIQPLAGEYGMHNNEPQGQCVPGLLFHHHACMPHTLCIALIFNCGIKPPALLEFGSKAALLLLALMLAFQALACISSLPGIKDGIGSFCTDRADFEIAR